MPRKAQFNRVQDAEGTPHHASFTALEEAKVWAGGFYP
jgi:hypothetical protein